MTNYSKLQHRTQTASVTADSVKLRSSADDSKCKSPHLNESPQHLAIAMVTIYRRMYCVERHNTIFAPFGPLSVDKLFTSLFYDASVTCLRVSDFILFSVSNSVWFSYIGRQAAPALRRTIGFNMQYRTSDVAENLGRCVFLYGAYSPEERRWIDSNGKNGKLTFRRGSVW